MVPTGDLARWKDRDPWSGTIKHNAVHGRGACDMKAGTARRGSSSPLWWPAVVDYVAQLQAAWWAWFAVGRLLLPRLRICFAAGAGLAPVHHERLHQRGGGPFVLDPGVYVDTSSYGRQGVDALVRALGIDGIVLGSDRPYATPTDPGQGAAAWRQISHNNPVRLIKGEAT